MAVHLITGFKGTEHIQSADQGSFNASFFGEGEFVMEAGNQCEASIIDNNTVRVLDGDILMQGRHIRIPSNTYMDLTIQTGTAGVNRNDLIVMEYSKDANTGIENADIKVLQGKASEGTAIDPAYTSGNILAGETLNQMPLYRVKVEGVVLASIEPLFTAIPTYRKLAEMYAQQFQEACDTYIGLLNILDTMEEVSANTQEGQLAGALAVKELAASKVSTGSTADLKGIVLDGSNYAFITNQGDDDITFRYKGANGSNAWVKLSALMNSLNAKLPLSGGTMTGVINSNHIDPTTADTMRLGSTANPYAIVRGNQITAHKNQAEYAMIRCQTVGTTSTVGIGELFLGNGTASGNANNAKGQIIMYNSGSNYAHIRPSDSMTSNITLGLPTKGGTVPSASLSGTTLTLNL